VKKALSLSTWARSIGFALMLAASGSVFGQGIVNVTPNPQPFYNVFYPLGTFDYGIDINGNGTNDFILRSNDSGSSLNNAVLIPLGDNEIVEYSSYVADMNAGDSVGSSLNPVYQWTNTKTTISVLAILLDQQSAEDGNFAQQASGYIGFDLVENGNNYYGWMYISSPVNDAGIEGNVLEWAYESSPNTPITVGAVPEPSTWALLAAGGATLFFRRKGRRTRECKTPEAGLSNTTG
jgi:hypothetical protein